MRFRPAAVPTLAVLVALLILVNLGRWQLRRHYEVTARKAHIEAQLKAPPLHASELGEDPEFLVWRLAEVEGHYLDVPPAFITARFEFGEPGYDVVQPLQIDGGPLVLVNRGFLPSEGLAAHLEATRPNGKVTVRGLVRPVDGDPSAKPIPPRGEHPERWRYPNYAAMARGWGIEPHLAIVAGDPVTHPDQKTRSPLPITGFVARPRSRPHLEYAGTWFLIAGALVVLWGYAGVRRAERLAS